MTLIGATVMKRILTSTIQVAVIATLMTAVGCTKMPSPEDLDKLGQQKSAADDAEQKVADLEKQKASLEQELADIKAVLQQHEEEFAELKNRK